MNRLTCLALLALAFASIPAACADNLKDDLEKRYKDQVIALRYPFVHGEQSFDSTGHPLSNPAGSWLIYGAIFVRELHLSPDMMRLEGPRVALTQPKGNDKPIAVMLDKNVKVAIHLDHPLNSLEDAQALLNRVFYLDEKDLQHARPEYRRADAGPPEEPVYHVGKSADQVKPPQPIYTAEPEYSETALREHVQGTVILSVVVDRKGTISRVRIEEPLGMGLDEQAVEGVEHWRFKPATRDGEPVPVEMKIEVSFNLGSRR